MVIRRNTFKLFLESLSNVLFGSRCFDLRHSKGESFIVPFSVQVSISLDAKPAGDAGTDF